jgi:uncharacterized repeat protein (TIGR02543 family)
MKKLFLALFLLLGTFIILSYVDVEDVDADSGSFSFSYNIHLGNDVGEDTITPQATTTRNYGDLVSIDAGTQAEHEYVGFLENGKVIPALNGSKSFRVTENSSIEVFYKPTGTTVVIFMDSNQDLLGIRYTDGSGYIQGTIPSIPSKPGLTPVLLNDGWNVDTSSQFMEDTIVYPVYESTVSADLTLSVENGTVSESSLYSFNQTVTVTANGSGTFNYWLKDGIIASLDETYSFTMADNHDLVAVYDSGFVADSDIFISANGYMVDGSPVILGQFDIPEDEDLVEWGILTSAMPGGITFDTPGVTVVNSSKYNPNTNEFVISFASPLDNFRAFIKTVNQTSGEVSTVYSYVQESTFAEDLIISEYIEGSSSNKVIELYNGTGQAIDLSLYSIELYANGASTPNNTENELTATISAGGTYALWNSSAGEAFKVVPGESSSVANFNGDDAIVLKKGTTVIDSIGQVGFDPGSEWGSSGLTTSDHSLVRNADILTGDTNPNDEYSLSEWTAYPQDTSTYLGSHNMNTGIDIITSSALADSINISGLSSVNVGETITLTESYPNDGLEGVIWVSSNESFATVDPETGVVTGVAEGSVTITAYSYFNHSVVASQSVNVLPIQTYDVTFDSNEGSAVTTQTVNGGETATEPTDPTRSGYEFAGWYTDDTTFLNLFNFANEVTENITLYAKWNEIYDIIYNLDGGTNNVSNPATYTVATDTITLAEPTQSGFVFAGWYQESDFSGTEVTEITIGTTGDITLYANWNIISSEPDLFISEYVEGGGYNKVIEIFNPTETAVDLTGYLLRYYSAGGTSYSELDLSQYGSIASGDVLVLTNSNSEVDPLILAESDDEIIFINHNGDDCYELVKNDVVIDSLGVWGDVDWGKDKTLVRLSSIDTGNVTYTLAEWESYSKDTLIYVGSHTFEPNPQ